MSKLSYQLSLKKYQRELGLDSRTFNALDVKYDDINLLKQLQILNPVIAVPASAPPANTGFYGTLEITNDKTPGSLEIDIYARLYFNGNPLTNEITISSSDTGQLEVLIADRLPNPSSTLVLRIRFEAGITSVNLDAWDRFTPGNITNNPLTENNYLDMVVDSGFIEGDTLTMTLITSTPD
jgi:hypothetical protein